MTLEKLKQNLGAVQKQKGSAEATVIAIEGAIQVLKSLIVEEQKDTEAAANVVPIDKKSE